MQELERKLKPNCLHVGLLQGGGDVHVHVEEPAFQIGDICFDKDILLVSYFHCPSSLPLSLLSLSSLLSSFSPFHRPSLFCLLDLQLREQRDKPDDKILLNLNDFDFGHPLDLIFRGKALPFKAALFSVDPEEVNFPQVHHLCIKAVSNHFQEVTKLPPQIVTK